MQKTQNISDVERGVTAVAGGLLTIYGISKRSPLGLLAAAAGGWLIVRGASGYCPMTAAIGASGEDAQNPIWHRKIHVHHAITVQRQRSEVYNFWRNFENLPQFMRHLKSVRDLGDNRSHWVANAPAGQSVEWDAVITDERLDELIAWRSLEGSQVPNRGIVRFQDAPGGRGTEIRVELEYEPPAGVIGAGIAKLFGEEPKGQVADDLRRFRSIMETGEVLTTDGQPSDRVRQAKGYFGVKLFGPGLADDGESKVSVR
jgi:uncharacterized membrane protein